jgi:multicomponent Na+:H+ antiporter subunit D
MSFNHLLPHAGAGAPRWSPALVIFLLGEERVAPAHHPEPAGRGGQIDPGGVMIRGVFMGQVYETRWTFLPGMDFVLRADAMTILFSSLSAILWLVTTVYAIGYLEGSPNRRRFFGYFSFCVTATMGVSLAGNLLTFLCSTRC